MRSTDVIAKQCSLSKQQSEKEAGLPATPLASTVTLVLPVFYVVGAQLFPCSATVRQPDIVFGMSNTFPWWDMERTETALLCSNPRLGFGLE